MINDIRSKSSILRQKAEVTLQKEPVNAILQHHETKTWKQIRDLEEFQTELEQLNEELKIVKARAEIAAKKFAEMYDFAPSGYFTLSQNGEIIELNLCASQMLGKEISLLKKSFLGSFISADTKQIFNLFLSKVFYTKAKESCEVTLMTNGALPIFVYLTGIVTEGGNRCLLTAVDITEREEAEEALRESEAKHSSMIANISDVIAIMGIDGILKYVSPNIEKFFGWLPNDLLGTKGWETIHPDDLEPIRNVFFSLLEKDNTSEIVEYRYKCKEGNYKLIKLTATNLKNNPTIVGILMNFHDITERKQAEEALTASETRYRRLFESAKDGILILDVETGKIMDVNPFLIKMLGYPQEQFIDNAIWEIGFFKDIIANPDKFLELKQKKYVRYDDILIETANGQMINVEFVSNVYSVDHHKVIQCNIRDITERKRAENDLFQAKEKSEELLKETQMQKSEIELQNERLESLLRISQYKPKSRQDLLDHALKEGIEITSSKIGYIYNYDESTKQFALNKWSREVMEECSELNSQSLDDLDLTGCWGEAVRQRRPIVKNNFQDEYLFKKGLPKGYVRLYRYLSIPVFIDNNIVAVVGVANKEYNYQQSDIRQLTLLMNAVWRILDRETMIENLKNAKEKAEESDRLKSAFLANMSHEIRTPMNGILGFASLLKEPKLSGEEQKEYISIIERSGARMLNIINDIMSISKVESGQMKVLISETNVNDQLDYLYTFFKPEVDQKGLQIRINSLLQAKEAIIKTDREKVYAILTNLIKNAVKFTSQGSIEFGCEIKHQNLEFFVRDTGMGIRPEQKEIIFERFRQGSESLTRKYEGAGLGLSISKAFVEMLGGRIWVESDPGKGSVFYFTLPYNPEPEDKIATKNIDSFEKESDQINKLKILIAEDDKISDKLLTIAVNSINKEVLKVRSGVEAIEVCRSNPDIDLIMMDIQMPEMDGYEATRQIRQFNKKVIIIAQTAFALSGDRSKAIKAGCNDYISKPINKDLLIGIIKKYFNK